MLLLSPHVVAKPTKLRLPRHETRSRPRLSLCNFFALALQLRFSLFWIGQLVGIRPLQLRNGLPLTHRCRDAYFGDRSAGRHVGHLRGYVVSPTFTEYAST